MTFRKDTLKKAAENRDIYSMHLLKTAKWNTQQECKLLVQLTQQKQTPAQQFKPIQELWNIIPSMTFLLFTHSTWIAFTSFPHIPVTAWNLLIFRHFFQGIMKSIALLSLFLDNKRSSKTTLKVLMGSKKQTRGRSKLHLKSVI